MKLFSNLVLSCAVIAALFGGAGQATANPLEPLPVNGGWESFIFYGVGQLVVPEFLVTGPAELQVTDSYLTGDMFSVYDNSALLGVSSVPDGSYAYVTDASGYGNPAYSYGEWSLPGGDNVISIIPFASPYGSGGAYIQAVSGSAVPEPSSFALLGLGGIGLACGAYRRRRMAAVV